MRAEGPGNKVQSPADLQVGDRIIPCGKPWCGQRYLRSGVAHKVVGFNKDGRCINCQFVEACPGKPKVRPVDPSKGISGWGENRPWGPDEMDEFLCCSNYGYALTRPRWNTNVVSWVYRSKRKKLLGVYFKDGKIVNKWGYR